jgi:regulator of protease activity HflC (stomatin/prohibitin superfamily)
MIFLGIVVGFIVWFLTRYLICGLYTVNQNERAVKTIFGKAERLNHTTTAQSTLGDTLNEEEKKLYDYPQVKIIPPGGPYFKWPWEKIHKFVVSTQTTDMAVQSIPTDESEDTGREPRLEAVTKDQLNTGLKGQIRCHISERNAYAFLFAIKQPIDHVMGFFISVLREKIANFEAPKSSEDISSVVSGISINDLRKNLNRINHEMEKECAGSEARYGICLDASLITEVEPPKEVESALAAINTTHNQVSSDISLAQASADQKIVQSKRAVEIETLRANAEVQPLIALSEQLQELKKSGKEALEAYIRNVKLDLFGKAERIIKK